MNNTRSKFLIDPGTDCISEAEKIVRELDQQLEAASSVALVTKEEEGIAGVFRFRVKEDVFLALRLFARLLQEYFLLFDYLDEISFSVFAASFFHNYEPYLLFARTIVLKEKDPEKLEERFYELCEGFAQQPDDPAVLLKLLAAGKARKEMLKKGTTPVYGKVLTLCQRKEELPEWFPIEADDPRPLLQMLRDRSLSYNCLVQEEEKRKQHLLTCRTLLGERVTLLESQLFPADRTREFGIAVKQYDKILKDLAELRIL